MSLDGNVIPGVVTVLASLVPAGGSVPPEAVGGATGLSTAPLKGLSYGPKLSIPLNPWAWVQNSSFSEETPQGSGLVATPWIMLCRLLYKWAPDQPTAERALASLIAPVRDAFRTNTMLAPWAGGTVRRSYVSGGEWGYVDVNGVWYRYVDLNINVQEKEVKRYS